MRRIVGTLMLVGLGVAIGAGCQRASSPQRVEAAASAPVAHRVAEMSDGELQAVLAKLARAHEQKMQLSMFVGLGVLPVGGPFKGYYSTMRSEQSALLSQLKEIAKAHSISLKFTFPEDTDGRALKIMEDRQEKLVRADKREDFERDMLMNMYQDYEWQISTLQALAPKVKDAGLKAYVEKSLAVHEAGSMESLRLLRKYKFVP